jgi:hypothetical protein
VEDFDPEGHKQARRHDDRQLVGLVVLFTLLAIGGWWLWGKVTQADDNSKSAASATTTVPPDVEAEVEAAYLAYSDMVQRLLLAPQPDDPELVQRATGDALDSLVAALNDLVASGDVARYGPTRSQTILAIEVSGDTATLRACFVDESGRYDATTGDEIDPMRVSTIVDTASLERRDGVWRVSSRKNPGPGEEWEGVHECDA